VAASSLTAVFAFGVLPEENPVDPILCCIQRRLCAGECADGTDVGV
jgi:hypothetical protein